jgi:predicted phosphodiesterase
MLARVISVLAVLVTAACAGKEVSFSGPCDAPGTTVAVYGDSQKDGQVHRKIIAGIAALQPAAVFHAGDLVDDGTDASQWEAFNLLTGPLRGRIPFYPALGNHEKDSPLYFENFVLPGNERWYSVRVRDMEWFVLDSESSLEPGSVQHAWLEEQLRTSTAPFRIVLLHRPLFSSSDDGGNRQLREYIRPLMERYRVSIVFSGHHHNYERSLVNGVYYVVTGGGGGKPDPRRVDNPYRQVFHKKYHFCAVANRDDTLTVTAMWQPNPNLPGNPEARGIITWKRVKSAP